MSTTSRSPRTRATIRTGIPRPAWRPWQVYEDDRVRVSATLVYHAPIFPAFAYRFDTDNGAVVFSGDTGAAGHDNLGQLAHGADVLVHEVIDLGAVRARYAPASFPPPAGAALRHIVPSLASLDALMLHFEHSHTAIEDVGPFAQSAGVKQVVLSHIVPGNAPDARFRDAQRSYRGQVVVGHDLLALGL
jgi:ribonuclease BN (tRNA processing enzyme)